MSKELSLVKRDMGKVKSGGGDASLLCPLGSSLESLSISWGWQVMS